MKPKVWICLYPLLALWASILSYSVDYTTSTLSPPFSVTSQPTKVCHCPKRSVYITAIKFRHKNCAVRFRKWGLRLGGDAWLHMGAKSHVCDPPLSHKSASLLALPCIWKYSTLSYIIRWSHLTLTALRGWYIKPLCILAWRQRVPCASRMGFHDDIWQHRHENRLLWHKCCCS